MAEIAPLLHIFGKGMELTETRDHRWDQRTRSVDFRGGVAKNEYLDLTEALLSFPLARSPKMA